MRNRGIEITLPSTWSQEDYIRVTNHLRLPSATSLSPISKESFVDFEFRRRGLLTVTEHHIVCQPSGNSLHEDSPSSAVLHLAPSLLSCPQDCGPEQDAFKLFAAASTAPAHVPHMRRYISHLGFLPCLGTIFDGMMMDKTWSNLDEARQTYGQIWPVSSDFLSVQVSTHEPCQATAVRIPSLSCTECYCEYIQPMDFFLKSIPLSHSYPELDQAPVHWSILRMLELFVRIRSQKDHEDAHMLVPSTSQQMSTNLSPDYRRAVDAAEIVMDSISELAETVAQHFKVESLENASVSRFILAAESIFTLIPRSTLKLY